MHKIKFKPLDFPILASFPSEEFTSFDPPTWLKAENIESSFNTLPATLLILLAGHNKVNVPSLT